MLLTLLAPIGALSALVFAFVMARRVLKLPEGNDQMKKISLAVRRGANAYLRRQYLGVAVFFATVSYTHLDVYKRQSIMSRASSK